MKTEIENIIYNYTDEILHILISVRCQTKVHNCKYSYLLCSFILLFSEIFDFLPLP